MIKLKEHFNYKGQILNPGKLVNLPKNLEKILVRNNKAEYLKQKKTNEQPPKETEQATTKGEEPSGNSNETTEKE